MLGIEPGEPVIGEIDRTLRGDGAHARPHR
jgi:hypothetical protein